MPKVNPLKPSDRIDIIGAINKRLRQITAPRGTEVVAGEGIEIDNNEISAIPYTAGDGIEIEDYVISTTGGGGGEGKTYTAGDGIEISDSDVISAKPYTAGDGIIVQDFKISEDPYVAGEGIEIEGREIKAKEYTAGDGIEIEDYVISATGGGGESYTPGRGIEINGSNVISTVTSTDGSYIYEQFVFVGLYVSGSFLVIAIDINPNNTEFYFDVSNEYRFITETLITTDKDTEIKYDNTQHRFSVTTTSSEDTKRVVAFGLLNN